jgi:hypothetical protein
MKVDKAWGYIPAFGIDDLRIGLCCKLPRTRDSLDPVSRQEQIKSGQDPFFCDDFSVGDYVHASFLRF